MDDKVLSEVPARWLGLPVIATVARILCRELTLQNEYLRLENKILKSKIQGELKKLGIEISKTTVANLLRRNGLPPSPDRPGLTWREFLSRHADVFVCADLFTKEIWTLKGLQTAFAFFVLHLQTRRILLARVTFSPKGPHSTETGEAAVS